MEKLSQYAQWIKQLLSDYAAKGPSDDEVQTEVVFDDERGHYQVVYTGWKNRRSMYGCVLHFNIRNGKIWFQYNGTEIDFADELVKLGVPKDDIVLAFQEPFIRQYSGYAIG